MRQIVIFSVFILTLNVHVMSQSKQTISVFKNGTGFFIKKVNPKIKDGVSIIENLPQALFGTIWFSTENGSIRSVTSELGSSTQKASTLFELLKANTGKKVRIVLQSGESVEGTIEKTGSYSKSEKIEASYIPLVSNSNTYLLLKTKDSWKTISDNSIRSIDFFDQPNEEFISEQSKRVVRLDFAKGNTSQSVDMMYMSKGIGWIPSYLITLKDEKNASLILTANFSNDAEDIQDGKLSLVVGVPNFAYSFLESPLTSKQTLAEFLQALNYGGTDYIGRGDLRNIASQSMSNTGYVSDGDGSSALEEAKITSKEDLYFYEIPFKVNLKKGDRAIYELLRGDFEYQHIYETQLATNSNDGYSYSYDRDREKKSKEPEKVWHSIQFKNTTGNPLTTGTVMIVNEENGIQKPISQDKLNYTVIGGRAKVKLTLSPDIEVMANEKETSREERVKKKDGYDYDLVNVEATITIKNRKSTFLKLNLTRDVWGEMIKSTHKWDLIKLAPYYYDYYLSKKNQVDWEVELKANESKEITYQYKVYIRRY